MKCESDAAAEDLLTLNKLARMPGMQKLVTKFSFSMWPWLRMITGLARETRSLMLWRAAQLVLWLQAQAQERSSAGNWTSRRSHDEASKIAQSTSVNSKYARMLEYSLLNFHRSVIFWWQALLTAQWKFGDSKSHQIRLLNNKSWKISAWAITADS